MFARRRLSQAFLVIELLTCTAVHARAPTPSFVVDEVFAGRSEGTGELRLGVGRRRPFTVQSHGAVQPDGRFRLDQEVRFAGEAPRSRTWILWQTHAGRYSATLTDAAGPVTAQTIGNRLTLRYPLTRWGLVMHQTLTLRVDGRTVDNVCRIRFVGITVGQLSEVIELHR
jgi:hypothetical protein